MVERTLVIIKPDGVRRNIIGKLIDSYEQENLKLVDIEMFTISRELAELHYAEHKGKDFYGELIGYITSGPSVIMELEGENAIAAVRKLNEVLRSKYKVNTTQNTVHGSDSPESAAREIDIFFTRSMRDNASKITN